MLSTPSPPHFINQFTISSAPVASLFLSCTFLYFLQGALICAEPLSFPSWCIYALNSPSNSSLVVGVPTSSLRQYSTSTSLFPFELLIISLFCALSVVLPVSASPVFFSRSYYPYPHLFHPAIKVFCVISCVFPYSLLVPYHIFCCLSSYSIFLPSGRSFTLVCISLYSYCLFCLSSDDSITTTYYQLPFNFVEQLVPSFHNSRSWTIIFSIVHCCTYAFHSSETCSAFLAISCWNSCWFFVPVDYIFSICTICSHASITLAPELPLPSRSSSYPCFPTAWKIALYFGPSLRGTLAAFFTF